MKVLIVRSGPQTTIQDLGRFGQRASGIGTAGALDPFAARIGNVLVGNVETAAVLEVALGNFRMRFEDERLIAWCGGVFDVRVADRAIPAGHVCFIGGDEEIAVRSAQNGCRLWFAISGGIDVPVVLGSRSTDSRAAFGGFEGRALRDGDELPLAEPSPAAVRRLELLRRSRVPNWSAPMDWVSTAHRSSALRFIRGTDWQLFTEAAHEKFLSAKFAVTREADRMAARLEGPELTRTDVSDLLSEAVAPGTVQVPPDGNPILLLGDCQTIGGYPKIAHVIAVDLSIAAQLRAADTVQFHECSLGEAQALLRERERDFALFRTGLRLRSE